MIAFGKLTVVLFDTIDEAPVRSTTPAPVDGKVSAAVVVMLLFNEMGPVLIFVVKVPTVIPVVPPLRTTALPDVLVVVKIRVWPAPLTGPRAIVEAVEFPIVKFVAGLLLRVTVPPTKAIGLPAAVTVTGVAPPLNNIGCPAVAV